MTKLCSSLLSDDEKEHLLNQLHNSKTIGPSTIVDFKHKRPSGYRLISRNRGYTNSKFLAELASTFSKGNLDTESEEDDVSILITNNIQFDSSLKSNIEVLPNELLLSIFVFLGNRSSNSTNSDPIRF